MMSEDNSGGYFVPISEAIEIDYQAQQLANKIISSVIVPMLMLKTDNDIMPINGERIKH